MRKQYANLQQNKSTGVNDVFLTQRANNLLLLSTSKNSKKNFKSSTENAHWKKNLEER